MNLGASSLINLEHTFTFLMYGDGPGVGDGSTIHH